MYDGLPEACLTLMPSDGSLIYIERGENGYHMSKWETSDPKKNREIADFYNEKRGVTKAQEQAMLNGSLFSWDIPAADPKYYETLSPTEVNSGYAIVRRATIGGTELVLGQNVKRPEMFVTWRRTPAYEHQGKPEYYWGHYFDKEYLAVADFDSRVKYETLNSKEYTEARLKSASKKRHEPERQVKTWKKNNHAWQTGEICGLRRRV